MDIKRILALVGGLALLLALVACPSPNDGREPGNGGGSGIVIDPECDLEPEPEIEIIEFNEETDDPTFLVSLGGIRFYANSVEVDREAFRKELSTLSPRLIVAVAPYIQSYKRTYIFFGGVLGHHRDPDTGRAVVSNGGLHFNTPDALLLVANIFHSEMAASRTAAPHDRGPR